MKHSGRESVFLGRPAAPGSRKNDSDRLGRSHRHRSQRSYDVVTPRSSNGASDTNLVWRQKRDNWHPDYTGILQSMGRPNLRPPALPAFYTIAIS